MEDQKALTLKNGMVEWLALFQYSTIPLFLFGLERIVLFAVHEHLIGEVIRVFDGDIGNSPGLIDHWHQHWIYERAIGCGF